MELRRHHFRWLACFLCLMLIRLGPTAVASEQPVAYAERQVKAAYLYKFGGYVDWPERAFPPDAPLKIGVLGAPDLADELAQVVLGRNVGGHPVSIVKLKPGDSFAGLNVLFIAAANNEHLPEILNLTRGQPILTVTETKDGLDKGGIINFVIVDGKLRFEVSSKAANQNSLSISARLLVAAYKVIPG